MVSNILQARQAKAKRLTIRACRVSNKRDEQQARAGTKGRFPGQIPRACTKGRHEGQNRQR